MKVFLTVLLGLSCGVVHWWHVSTLSENEKHFSHLSTLEREMSFYSEQAFYYSFYKRLVTSRDMVAAFQRLLRDDRVEAPSSINSLRRFNIYPEVLLAVVYEGVSSVSQWTGGIGGRQCWRVRRGSDMPVVYSCTGLLEPVYLYLHAVWLLSAFTAIVIFVLGCHVSGGVLGGVVSFLCFMVNHGDAVRVMWAAPLRENFALPYLLGQLVYVCRVLKAGRPVFSQLVGVACTSCVCLLFWQLCEFWLLSQMLILLMLWTMRVVPGSLVRHLASAVLVGCVCCSVLMFIRVELLCCPLVAVCVTLVLCVDYAALPVMARFADSCTCRLLVSAVMLAGVTLQLGCLQQQHDRHVWRLLWSKLGGPQDWHTRLYSCAAEFDLLDVATVRRVLLDSLLFPAAVTVVLLRLARWTHNVAGLRRLNMTALRCDADTVYLVVQSGVAVCLAIMFMRLKLLATPLLCVLCAILAARDTLSQMSGHRAICWTILVVVLSRVVFVGVRNIHQQHAIIGEYSEPDLEHLLMWVKSGSDENAVFAAPMALSSTILLTTNRRIANHPHYEHEISRRRNKLVYQMYSQRSAVSFYHALRSLHVDYVVVDRHSCLARSRKGCSVVELWQKEERQVVERASLCEQLCSLSQPPAPFMRVFTNTRYTVLRLPASFVELPPPVPPASTRAS